MKGSDLRNPKLTRDHFKPSAIVLYLRKMSTQGFVRPSKHSYSCNSHHPSALSCQAASIPELSQALFLAGSYNSFPLTSPPQQFHSGPFPLTAPCMLMTL